MILPGRHYGQSALFSSGNMLYSSNAAPWCLIHAMKSRFCRSNPNVNVPAFRHVRILTGTKSLNKGYCKGIPEIFPLGGLYAGNGNADDFQEP